MKSSHEKNHNPFLTRTDAQGRRESYHRDPKSGLIRYTDVTGKQRLTYRSKTPGLLYDQILRREEITPEGQVQVIEQNRYDEKGRWEKSINRYGWIRQRIYDEQGLLQKSVLLPERDPDTVIAEFKKTRSGRP